LEDVPRTLYPVRRVFRYIRKILIYSFILKDVPRTLYPVPRVFCYMIKIPGYLFGEMYPVPVPCTPYVLLYKKGSWLFIWEDVPRTPYPVPRVFCYIRKILILLFGRCTAYPVPRTPCVLLYKKGSWLFIWEDVPRIPYPVPRVFCYIRNILILLFGNMYPVPYTLYPVCFAI
jgi:hypothetical protein